MSDQQYQNALKLAFDAYDAGNENEAVSFFNQALTIDPNSCLATTGKGAAVLLSFTLAGAATDASEAFTLWQRAANSPDYSSKEMDLISSACLGFCATWKKGAEHHFRQFKDTAGAKNDWALVKDNIKTYVNNVSGLKGMNDHIGFIEGAIDVLKSVIGILDASAQKLEQRLFVLKHKYRATIEKAMEVLPARNDYDGDCHIHQSAKEVKIEGKIDIEVGKTKFNDIRVRFVANRDDSIELGFYYKDAPKLRQPDVVEKELSAITLWKIKRDKEKIEFLVSYELRNDDVAGALDSIQQTIDTYLVEGKKIVEIVEKNGGKKGLFG